MKATIWHNPACGTSRKTLAILEETPGIELKVVHYLKTPPSRDEIKHMFRRAGMTAREGLRLMGTSAEAQGLTKPETSEDAILDAMASDPILINRPIVETEKGVRLCRPQERVRDIL